MMENLTKTEVQARSRTGVTISRADAQWVRKLYDLSIENYQSYPELYTMEEEETMQIAGVIIRGMK